MTKVQRNQLNKFINESLPNEQGAFGDLVRFYKNKSKDPVEASVQYIVNSWFKFKANKIVTKIRKEAISKHHVCKHSDAKAWLLKKAKNANGADHFAMLELVRELPNQPYVRVAGNGIPDIALGVINKSELTKIWKDMRSIAVKMLKQA